MPVIEWQENIDGEVMVWLVSNDRKSALMGHGKSLAEALRNLADLLDKSEVK